MPIAQMVQNKILRYDLVITIFSHDKSAFVLGHGSYAVMIDYVRLRDT